MFVLTEIPDIDHNSSLRKIYQNFIYEIKSGYGLYNFYKVKFTGICTSRIE